MEPNELFTNRPYFDFNVSIEDYGFDFDHFSEDSFSSFIKSTLIDDFVRFRIKYLSRDFDMVKRLACKFKGCFSLIVSEFVCQHFKKIQTSIEMGNIELDDLYADVIARMEIFFEKFKEFCQAINIRMSEELVENFYNECNEVNYLEGKNLQKLISEKKEELINNKKLFKTSFKKQAQELKIDTGKQLRESCCSGVNCNIF
jgi:hypothetical protein